GDTTEPGVLNVGETWVYTVTYQATQADINAGTTLVNTATVDTDETEEQEDTAETTIDQNQSVDITKTLLDNEDELGGLVTFEIKVTNTGNVTLFNLYVQDETAYNAADDLDKPNYEWFIAELTPGAEWTEQVEVEITQELIDGKCYENTAIVEVREYLETEQTPNGQGPSEEEYVVVLRDSSIAEACFTQEAELTITKTILSGDPYALIGDEIEYQYVLENTGTVTLTGPFTVEDDKIQGTIADATNTALLAPGESITFTATYVVVEGDLSAGSVTNIATGFGFFGEGEGREEIESEPDTQTADAQFNDIIARDDAAGTFSYSLTAQVATLNAFDNDELKGAPATNVNVILTTVIPDPEGVLSVDANGVVTIAADAPAGDYQLTYRITEVGNPSNFDEAIITATVEPELLLDLIETFCELDAPYIRWKLIPANFAIGDLAPNDATPFTMIWLDKNGNEIIRYENIAAEGQMLFPGAEVDADGFGTQWPGWRLVNGQWESGDFNFAAVRDGASVRFELNPEVTSAVAYPGATSECNPNPNPPLAVDDDMRGTPVVSALGFTDIVNVLDNDQLNGKTGLVTPGDVTVSFVGESTPGVLVLDVNTGLVSVTPGTPSGIYTLEYRICTNPNPTNCDTAVVTVLVVTPSIEILKDGEFNDENGDGFGNVGETITYAFTVINTGDIDLTNVTIEDDKVDVQGSAISLGVGESNSTNFTATYVLTQTDIDKGLVSNIATARGEGPGGYPVEDESEDPTPIGQDITDPECEGDCTITEIPQNPAIQLLKDGEFNDENGDGFGNVGETITYTFTVTNTGNVTLSNVIVTDEKVAVQGGPIASLAVGASDNTTFTATYVLTQQDIDNGLVSNVALATGTSPKGVEVTDESEDPTPIGRDITDPECEGDCTITEIPQNPAIELLKDGEFNDENGDGFGNVGETITYTFTVTNTGNVTLSNVTVTDVKVAVQGGPIASLAVGASDNTTFTATYVLTQQDIDNGLVSNVALATGTSPKGVEVTDESEDPTPIGQDITDPECEGDCTITEIPQNPAIELLKDGEFNDENGDGFGNVGETITYTFTVTNTGNVTLSNVTVTDEKVVVQGGPIASLAVGASDNTTFTATYVLTQQDIDNGLVSNVALATGTSPKGVEVTDESEDPTPIGQDITDPECEGDCTITEIPQNPVIDVVKSDNGAEINFAGETITYSLTVSNLGNVTLNNIIVQDPLTGLDVNIGSLAPGATNVLSTDYVVTQEDVDNGSVLNTVFVTSESPDGETPTDEDEVTTEIEPNPSIDLDKTVDVESVSRAGIELNYTLVVTNTGNVTLTGGNLKDPKTGLEIPELTLAPQESATFQTTYTVTLEDILSGEPILNIANVQATPRSGGSVEAEDRAVVNINLTPGIEIVKTADKEKVTKAGEVITYTIKVTNTGTAPLTNVMVTDPLTGFEAEIPLLLADEVEEFTTTYTVTIEDIASQEPIVNVAKVSATNPIDPDTPIESEDEEIVSIECTDGTLVTGIIFRDLNSDNIFNPDQGETPLAGVPVTLIPRGDTPGEALIVITGTDGRYLFEGFVPGDYTVQVQDVNLNSARGLFPTQSSLSFPTLEACAPFVKDFGYETYDGIVLGDFVWYDINQDGIQNEWFDANDDGQVTLNDPTAGAISVRDWEWFDLNGDGRYDGPENEGELNKAGFGVVENTSGNVRVTGPNGYEETIIVGILGYWRDRPYEEDGEFLPTGNPYGDYTATLIDDDLIAAMASFMEATGKVKVLPEANARMTDINGIRFEEQCGLTTEGAVTKTITAANPEALDMDFGWRCQQVGIEIIANDDDFGTHFISFGGVLGNILENDILNGVTNPDPDLVDFEFTELDGIVGLLINENGELSLVPGVNEAREYTLRYTLRETAFPDNQDDAIVVFRLLNDQVDLAVEKTSFEAEIYEGDEFEYEIRLSNVGGTPATGVELVDDLPANVTYLSSNVVSVSDSQIQVGTPSVTGGRITWAIPFFPADGEVVIRVRVQAGDTGVITNLVEVSAAEEDVELGNNRDDDVNNILPFRIPNVITPELEDGDNDTFEILGLGKFVSNEIVIINRYGDHVLEQEDYKNDWNAPGQVAGTYYYILKVVDRQGKQHEFKGWIQVIKGNN
ncbi:DUF7507 domain-containing protein, partial [Algoriphagus namhaensis]